MSRPILASGDINSSPILAKRFRGKFAKEVYRYTKKIVMSHSLVKPVVYVILTILGKMTKGVISSAVGQAAVNYMFSVRFLGYKYKTLKSSKLKATTIGI